MTFIDPCNDWAFKRIFGSRESGAVLLGFLNDLLYGGLQIIQSVTILDPYLPSQVKHLKNSVVDVRATLSLTAAKFLLKCKCSPWLAFARG